jgi:maltoporin
MKPRPPRAVLCVSLAIAIASMSPHCLAQSNSSSNDGNDVSALKIEIEKMRKDYDEEVHKIEQHYEDRISAMEAEVKALESNAGSGSILNTRILTDADGKTAEGPVVALDESFLKSLTRNFTFSAYVRVGFQFNGNGGGGNFSFDLPMFLHGRERLGNENDTFIELSWIQAHMLGDGPDVMDVSMTFTPDIRYIQSRNTFTASKGGVENSGNDFDFIWRQAFFEAKNVFKTAPEVTFWAGSRFYDRWNTDPDDYFWLDDSGYGAGVKDINAGIGKLWVAWLAGLNADYLSPSIGTYFKHTFDLRLKDIDVGIGRLMLVLLGNYEKGSTFTTGYDTSGDQIALTNPLRFNSAWGVGGGGVYTLQFGPGGGNNSLTVYALFGRGATNFSSGDNFGLAQDAENTFLFYHPGFAAGKTIDVGDVIDHAFVYRAGFEAYIALPWYQASTRPMAPTDGKNPSTTSAAVRNPDPWFSLGMWGNWEEKYNGSAVGAGVLGTSDAKVVSGHYQDMDFGVRPAIWLADSIALQSSFGAAYETNENLSSTASLPGFGARHGWLGVFDVGPVIKPKGGYYTKPEFRLFATYAIWSDSLKGMVTPASENGGSDFMPPYNGNTNHGWLFGTQVEWFF